MGKSLLPLYFHVFRHVVCQGAVCIPVGGGKEAADDAADVFLQAEVLRIVHTIALYSQTETTDAFQYYRVTVSQTMTHHIFQLFDDSDDITLPQRAVASSFLCEVLQVHITLPDGLCEVLAIAAAALNVVFYQLYLYTHRFALDWFCCPFLLHVVTQASPTSPSACSDALRKRPLGPSAGRYITQIVVEFPNFRNLPSPSLFIRNLLSYSEYHA